MDDPSVAPDWLRGLRPGYWSADQEALDKTRRYLSYNGWDLLNVGDEFDPKTDEILSSGYSWEKRPGGFVDNDNPFQVEKNNWFCRTPIKWTQKRPTVESNMNAKEKSEGDRLMDFFFGG